MRMCCIKQQKVWISLNIAKHLQTCGAAEGSLAGSERTSSAESSAAAPAHAESNGLCVLPRFAHYLI